MYTLHNSASTIYILTRALRRFIVSWQAHSSHCWQVVVALCQPPANGQPTREFVLQLIWSTSQGRCGRVGGEGERERLG